MDTDRESRSDERDPWGVTGGQGSIDEDENKVPAAKFRERVWA